MIKPSCNNCRYAHVGEIDQNLQRQIACRRFPPAVYPHPQGVITLFPVVNTDMHCGEFRPDGIETPVVNTDMHCGEFRPDGIETPVGVWV